MKIDAFYSDPHFGHKNILKYCPTRQALGSTIEEHDEALIRRYNATVTPNMNVCWVGDCFWYNVEKSMRIMNRLNGSKILVVGNHDKKPIKMAEIGFSLVADRFHIMVEEFPTLVCHYPYAGAKYAGDEYDERFLDIRPVKTQGQWLIHGHSHVDFQKADLSIHVGVDAWDYKPALYEEVYFLMKARV